MKTIFAKSIVIQLSPSPLLLALLLAVATISSLIVLSLSMLLSIKLILFGFILLSSAYFIARDALLALPWSWRIVEVDTKGVLTLVNKRQQRIQAQLAPTTFVHEYCVILNLKNQGMHWALPPVLLFNNVDNADALRRLRVWLRLFENKRGRKMIKQVNGHTSTSATR